MDNATGGLQLPRPRNRIHDPSRALGVRPDFIKALQGAVDRVSARLAVTEKVRRIVVADGPFMVGNEQMTPSLKIRRHVLKGAYGERLDRLYGG